MRTIILPLSKSPHPTGRVGEPENQDWWRGLVIAISLLRKYPDSKILILSALQVSGERSEVDIYCSALKKLGVSKDDIMVVEKCRETIEQIEVATQLAKEEGAELIIISTFLHYPRVRWLCRGLAVRHRVAWGIPRPYEAVTDPIAMIVFPIIDTLGLRQWLMNKVQARRLKGKF